MNQPAYFLSKMMQRANYNIGRVQKEAGLCKSLIPPTLIFCSVPNLLIFS